MSETPRQEWRQCGKCARWVPLVDAGTALYWGKHPGPDGTECAVSDRPARDRRREAVEFERNRRLARATVDAEETPREPLAYVFDGDETLVPPDWLVDGLIPVEGCGMLFGESDLGKTFTAVSIGVHVSADRPWM